jgi:hypothetical protein
MHTGFFAGLVFVLLACGAGVDERRDVDGLDAGDASADDGKGWACIDVGAECRKNENMCCQGFCLQSADGSELYQCAITCVRDENCGAGQSCRLLESFRIGRCVAAEETQ